MLKRTSTIAIAVLLCALLAGCTGGAATPNDAVATPAPTPTEQPAATPDTTLYIDWDDEAVYSTALANYPLDEYDGTYITFVAEEIPVDDYTQIVRLPTNSNPTFTESYLSINGIRYPLGFTPYANSQDGRGALTKLTGTQNVYTLRMVSEVPGHDAMKYYRIIDHIPYALCETTCFTEHLTVTEQEIVALSAYTDGITPKLVLSRIDLTNDAVSRLNLSDFFGSNYVDYDEPTKTFSVYHSNAGNYTYESVSTYTYTNGGFAPVLLDTPINPPLVLKKDPDLSGLTPPPVLPEYNPVQTVFYASYYEGEVWDNLVWHPFLEDTEGNPFPMPKGTVGIDADRYGPSPFDWMPTSEIRFPDAYKQGCYLLTNGEKLAVMTLDGALLADFTYDYRTSMYGYDRYYSVKGYLRIQRYEENAEYPEYLYGLLDLRTGEEIIPCIYKYLDLYDGFLHAVTEDGSIFILDYTGEILCDLKERHAGISDYIDFVNEARLTLKTDAYGAVLGKKPYVDAILEDVRNRQVTELAYTIEDDAELRAMLERHNEETQTLHVFFQDLAIKTVYYLFYGIQIENGYDYYGKMRPEANIMSYRIADHSLYRNHTERFLADPAIMPWIDAESGGSAASWPYSWHTSYLRNDPEIQEALASYLDLEDALEAALVRYGDNLGE